MKIITLHQPWASLIALGLKQYETRSWSTKYRGKLAIHAGKTNCCKSPFQTIGLFVGSKGLSRDIVEKLDPVIMNGRDLPTGVILAVVDLTQCWRMINYIDRIETAPESVMIDTVAPLEQAVGDWRHGRYAWRLENNSPLPEPIPFTGSQGLRSLDLKTIAKIEDSLKITA